MGVCGLLHGCGRLAFNRKITNTTIRVQFLVTSLGELSFITERGGGVCLWGDQKFLGWSKGGPVFFSGPKGGGKKIFQVGKGGTRIFFTYSKDVPTSIPKSDLLRVTMAVIHVAGQQFLVWNGLNQVQYSNLNFDNCLCRMPAVFLYSKAVPHF